MFETLFLLLSSVILSGSAQGYCTRAAGLYNVSDGGIACMQASLYNVADCCFTCDVIGPTYNARCGSLYNYNTAQSCSDMAAITQAQTDCGGTGFTCRCNGGSDFSQLMGTPSPSAAPTSGAANNHNSVLLIMTGVVVVYTSFDLPWSL